MMSLKRRLGCLLAVLIVLGVLAGCYWMSLRISINHLETGIRDRDVVKLEKYIDWRVVREQLRSEIRGVAMRHVFGEAMKKEGGAGNFLGAFLAGTVAPAMVDQLVDNFMTPQGLTSFLMSSSETGITDLAIKEVGFTDLDEYTILFGRTGIDPAKMMRAVLTRQGITWRVVRAGFSPGEAPWEAVAPPGPGLELGKIAPSRTANGLIVEGEIANIGTTARDVPRLRIALRDPVERETQFKIIDPPKERLMPGETAHFRTLFDHPDDTATGVLVTFATRVAG
jgi:hypothetical protein